MLPPPPPPPFPPPPLPPPPPPACTLGSESGNGRGPEKIGLENASAARSPTAAITARRKSPHSAQAERGLPKVWSLYRIRYSVMSHPKHGPLKLRNDFVSSSCAGTQSTPVVRHVRFYLASGQPDRRLYRTGKETRGAIVERRAAEGGLFRSLPHRPSAFEVSLAFHSHPRRFRRVSEADE